jgi:DNA-binding MarR family transcriptional regulator
MALSDKQCLQINQALFSLAHAYESRLTKEEARRPTGMTLADRGVLMVLGQFASMNSRQLSRAMDINPGTISVYVERLIRKDLVEKVQHKDDRRHWLLSLTPAGQKVYRETVAGAVAYTRDFLSNLTQMEKRTLQQLLLKASHSLGFEWQ